MNLRGRQKDIFEIVVEEFIKTARPVSSEFLAENYDLKVSSATIRNDLSLLEEIGFLAKPHISGGRLPTADGWHYFIAEIKNSDFSSDELLKLRSLTTDLLDTYQEITNCVSKFFPDASEEFFRKFLINKLFKNHGRRK